MATRKKLVITARNTSLLKPNEKWHEQEFKTDPLEKNKLPPAQVKELQEKASKLLKDDIDLYNKHQNNRKNRSQFQWIQTVMKSGTIADRLAAITILVQDSAVHNLSCLEDLISMVNVKAKRESIMAMDTLRDLFISDLLVEDKRLRKFHEHPLHKLTELSSGNRDAADKRLILWQFEHLLQQTYTEFINALNVVARDTVEATKSKAVAVMYDLLVSNREKEEILLPSLTNKLGDPMHKVAAKGAEKLLQLVEKRPDRKAIIIQEVERFLFRPNVGDRAQYYSICFLNQMILSHDEEDLASRLISTYFAFFKAKVKRNEVNTKMMSALLTGVNRAYPYSKKNDSTVSEHINTMYKVVHTVSFNISVQALMLIHRVLENQNNISDRYYSALYRKLFSTDLQQSTRHAMLLNLLYQTLKKDEVKNRIQAFFKRLLQICFTLQPPIICSILYLLSEIGQTKPNIPVLTQRSCDVIFANDDDEEHFVDADKEENESNDDAKNNAKGSSWHHKQNFARRKVGYDPFHRNPTFCGAEHCCDWELISLSRHYHPSVALFSQKILTEDGIRYPGDPLQDFTLIRFLDRFVYRNPKKEVDITNQDTRKAVLGRRQLYRPAAAKRIPVDSKEFISRREYMVPVDEKFLYQYFSNKDKTKNVKKKKEDEDDSDIESVQSEEFEEMLTKFEPNDALDENELDFAADINKTKNKKKKGAVNDNEEDDSGMSDDDDDDFDNDDEFEDAFKDYDEDMANAEYGNFDEEELLGFNDVDEEEDEDLDSTMIGKKKRKGAEIITGKNKKMKSSGFVNPKLANIFAAAEEFGAIMDDNANDDIDTTTMNAMANKDKADVKQLKWEQKRDAWIRGADWKSKKHFGVKSRKNKFIDKKRKGPFNKKQKKV